ncbi:MAG: ATP-dependent helicase [Planctomycetota bacterium]
MSLFDSLNDAQKQAVITVDGPILIIAGAGTGKTKTITHRIAFLIEKGVNPLNILVVTFTNRAAKEIKERSGALLGKKFGDLLVTTFHSLGLKIIKENAAAEFIVYDRAEQINLLRKLSRGTVSSIQKKAEKISRIKNLLEEPDHDTVELYEDYQIELSKNSALDFDDLIIKPIEILKDRTVLNKYLNLFRYVLVDEYQDINPSQYQLLRLLAGESGNVCAVGDSDQAIYAFRGSDVGNFINFQKDFLSASLINLTVNYRSTSVILNASNNLIKNNIKRIDKELGSVKNRGRKIMLISVPDEVAEGEVIMKEIEERMGGTSRYQHYKGSSTESEREFRFSDFAILIRTNAQSGYLEETFIRSGIPYQIVGGKHFLERQEIKDVLAYVKIIVNPSDSISVERIINRPPRGIGEKTVAVIMNYANKHGLSLYEAMRAGSGLTGDKRKRISEFVALIEYFIKLKYSAAADELLNSMIIETGLKEFYSERSDSFMLLKNFSTAYQDIKPFESNQNFIRDITLLTPDEAYDPNADRVTIMTIHMAKGLEFETVFISGVEDGLLPYTFRDDNEIEEERRLFYVGMTRAKEELLLLYSRNRFLYGQNLSQSPSRFIKEIPDEFIEKRFEPDRSIKKKEKPQMGLF